MLNVDAASFHVSGLPAVLIFLALVALIVIGIVAVVRSVKRRGR